MFSNVTFTVVITKRLQSNSTLRNTHTGVLLPYLQYHESLLNVNIFYIFFLMFLSYWAHSALSCPEVGFLDKHKSSSFLTSANVC